MQSILSAHGPAATAIAELAWVLFAGGAAILLAVLVLTAYAVSARPAWLAREGFIVAAGIAFPVLVLSVLLAYVYVIGSPNAAHSGASLKIEVIAEQWWWRVRYPGFETANEIRIPAGRPVELVLRSADVIHSFWVPSLAGKVDMIPGRDNRLRLVAQKPGEFRGQCAEFCGGPHAKMALHVIAEEPGRFETWLKNQLQEVQSGHALFLARCAVCHTVRGTAAAGTRGPDLTHVGSRRFIAAGTLPNTQGNLAAWIAGSQHIKPGNLMPSLGLSGEQLQSLAAYLASLE
jgi:cytochrome c oxidase subunit II